MLNREELKEIAKMRGDDAYFVSLYLNVNPITNVKDNYVIHVKNMIKQTSEKLDKAVLKRIGNDIEKVESYILSNKRIFKKGLAILSSQEKKFWKEFHFIRSLFKAGCCSRSPGDNFTFGTCCAVPEKG